MRHKISSFAAIFCCVCLAESISAIEVEFEGSPPTNHSRIVKLLNSRNDPSFTMLDSLASDLMNRGYLDATIEIRAGQLVIRAGNRYMLTQIVLLSDSTATVEMNQPFDSALVSTEIDRQLQKLRANGYLYVAAEVQQAIIQGNSVQLNLEITRGPRVALGERIFAGLKRTDPKLLSRYIPVESGQTLSSETLRQAEYAARQIPFLHFQPPLKMQPRPGYTVSDLVFDFLEKTPVRFEGAAGYTGQEGGVVWSLDLTLNNLLGKGKEVHIVSEQRERGRRILDLSYSQPLFLMGPGQLDLIVRTRDYRDEFYEFSLEAGFSARLSGFFTTGVRLGWKTVEPERGATGYKRLNGQFSIARHTTLETFNPHRGTRLQWAIDFSFRKYAADPLPPSIENRSYNETRNIVRASHFQPILGPTIIRTSIHYNGLETGESLPPLSELVFIGGPGSLRGYRNEQFAAIRTAYGTLEPRLRFQSGFAFIFYDAAYINNRVISSSGVLVTEEEYRWSYGLGLGVGSVQRSLVLSLGWNPDLGFNEPRLSIELSSDI